MPENALGLSSFQKPVRASSYLPTTGKRVALNRPEDRVDL
jgi:hypothetical protein